MKIGINSDVRIVIIWQFDFVINIGIDTITKIRFYLRITLCINNYRVESTNQSSNQLVMPSIHFTCKILIGARRPGRRFAPNPGRRLTPRAMSS